MLQGSQQQQEESATVRAHEIENQEEKESSRLEAINNSTGVTSVGSDTFYQPLPSRSAIKTSRRLSMNTSEGRHEWTREESRSSRTLYQRHGRFLIWPVTDCENQPNLLTVTCTC